MGSFTAIQEQVVKILSADPYFARVPVIAFQKGDLASQIKEQIAKLGICVIVRTPMGDARGKTSVGPYMDPIRVVVDVIELVITNRGTNGTKLACDDVAERVAARLHSQNYPNRRDTYLMAAGGIQEVADKMFVFYQVKLTTAAQLAVPTEE